MSEIPIETEITEEKEISTDPETKMSVLQEETANILKLSLSEERWNEISGFNKRIMIVTTATAIGVIMMFLGGTTGLGIGVAVGIAEIISLLTKKKEKNIDA